MTIVGSSKEKISQEERIGDIRNYVMIECDIENDCAKASMTGRRFGSNLMRKDEELEVRSVGAQAGASPSKRQNKQRGLSSNHDDSYIIAKDDSSSISVTDDPVHMFAIITLCCVILTQAYLLISVFPYAGYMAIHLLTTHGEQNVNASSVGTYAGIISSAFMVGRFLVSVAWGEFADRYGRRSALLLSLGLSGIFSFLFGTSPTYGMALLYRFCLGLSNGLLPVTKTLVSELAKGNHSLEEKSMGLVVGIWGYGFLLCPGISGLLSEPLEQYPNLYNALVKYTKEPSEETSASPSWFMGRLAFLILDKFPFILPNLIALCWCCISLVLVLRFVHETLSDEERTDLTCNSVVNDVFAKTSQMRIGARNLFSMKNIARSTQVAKAAKSDGRNESMLPQKSTGIVTSVETSSEFQSPEQTPDTSSSSSVKRIWSIRATRDHLMVYWFFSFYSMLLDEAFPLFCMSQLGLSEYKIGEILTGAGLLFIFGQYFFYSWSLKKFGLYGVLKYSVLISSFPILIAASTWINVAGENNSTNNLSGILSLYTFTYLSIIFAIFKIVETSFFASITVMINRTVEIDLRGSVNGVGVMGGSIARAAGPVFAGSFMTLCQTHGLGGLTIFGVISVIGFLFYAVTRNIDDRGLVEFKSNKCI